ncbi:MAG: hypothetical protein ACHQF2_08055 [Flavobacteriales bacterium]
MYKNKSMRCFNYLKQTTLLLFLLSNVSFAQTGLNQLDSLGKKHGKWVLYLNALGKDLKNSTGAVYCRYTYYDHGKHLQPMGGFIGKKGKLVSTDTSKTNGVTLLDGEYKCLDKKGRLRFIHVFKNGEYVSYTEYYKSGIVNSYFDYTKKWGGQEHSWYIYENNKKGKRKYDGYFRNGHRGWVIYFDRAANNPNE